ncbi:Pentatricopeptide repeat-containing protein [Quillaja saponaria]|uniref:Pentatricopeptide repeat-containing protein n=1 Tax=Quillaja saponaria TaxID=32244 RepID=A0AAD7Q0U2_QUISA|nr:Pentatricopeptide repeat-containing protein [Quillaja saponaria]
MLAVRKLRISSPSPFLRLLVGDFRYNVAWVSGNWADRSIIKFFGHSSNNSSTQNIVSGLQNIFTLQVQYFSGMAGTILVQARDPAKVSMEIQNAIDENQLNDTWKLFELHMQMDGFPRKSVFNKLLVSFVESLDLQWIQKAYGLVEQAFEESKQNLLEKEVLIYLSFGLAKSGLPVPASTILRKLVAMELFPPVTAWSAVLAHMSQTTAGAYLAVELILEIGYLFQDGRVDPRKKINSPLIAMKPNTTAFNIALAGCVLFGTTRKAEQLLDMMPHIGVKADANLLVIMAHVYARNGRREELKKLQRHIEEAQLTDIQFRQFYNCLLTCHLKFGDLDSASNMVLEMLRKAKEAKNSLAAATFLFDALGNVNKYSPGPVDLITTEHGILQPTERIYVKLVKTFLEAGKMKDLAEFLIKAEKADSPLSSDNSALVHVINSCISLGWLDQAHDLLDEMRLAGIRTGSSVYASLLRAYCQANRAGEVTSLLRDARKAGIQLDSSSYEALIQSRRLMQDAEKALKKMRSLGHTPNAQTFHSMVTGYAAIGGKYLEVTELWGEMKSLASSISMNFDQELLDSVLYTFVRGGFFARANEVVEMMEKGNMFIDKYKYRTLFLKYHRTLYKGKAPKFQTEAQLKKRDAGSGF